MHNWPLPSSPLSTLVDSLPGKLPSPSTAKPLAMSAHSSLSSPLNPISQTPTSQMPLPTALPPMPTRLPSMLPSRLSYPKPSPGPPPSHSIRLCGTLSPEFSPDALSRMPLAQSRSCPASRPLSFPFPPREMRSTPTTKLP